MKTLGRAQIDVRLDSISCPELGMLGVKKNIIIIMPDTWHEVWEDAWEKIVKHLQLIILFEA